MAETAFVATLVEEISYLLGPLEESLQNEDAFRRLLERYGWDASNLTVGLDAVRTTMSVAGDLKAVAGTLNELRSDEGSPTLDQLTALVDRLLGATDKIRKLVAAPAPAGLSSLWGTFTAELPDGLVADYLERRHTLVFGLLTVFGVIEERAVDLTGQPGRRSYTQRRIVWKRLGPLLTNPAALIKEVYGWGDAARAGDLFLLPVALARLTSLTGLPVTFQPAQQQLLDAYFATSSTWRTSVRELRIPLMVVDDQAGNRYDAFLFLLPVPPPSAKAAPPAGLVLGLRATSQGSPPQEVLWPVSLELSGQFESGTPPVVELLPGRVGAALPGATELDAGIAVSYDSPRPLLLIGTRSSHRVQARGFGVAVHASGPLADLDVEVELSLHQGELILDSDDADGFLTKIFGTERQRAELDLAVGWSSKRGLHFRGQGALELTIPINRTVGVVEVLSLALGLRAGSAGAELVVGLSGSAKLGPVGVSVQNVGLLAAFRPVGQGQPPGLLGDLDFGFGFKPPDGLGIAVNAGPVTGGGFLLIDRANGRYAGILQLRVGIVAITAIGLLDTRLPGGEEGFSFLIIVTAKFSPIQLGFGFTLNGVGGLAGINRTIVVAALQAGVRSHSLDGLLFPEDPARDAPQIISDLRAIFPPVSGRYVFGPMALLGYGSPTLLEAELGIILELPMPLRIVLLGQLNAALPDKKKPVVELHLDVLGVLDFGAKLLSIDASLHDSRIAAFNVFGDMAMRLSWGEEPTFVLSVGGFHPAFRAPPEFPQLRRLTVALGEGENPRLMLQTYLAVTSNTFQIGARVELYAEAAGFNLAGWLGFDALFVFSPFSFRTDFSAGFALRRGSTVIAGIHLEATLTGPTPFHAWGEASLSILFFEIKVAFDKTFGVEELILLALGNPWPLLQAAVEDLRNWSATLPPAAFQVVSLTTPTGAGDEPMLVDPVGGLTLRQKVVPLDRTLTKFGEAPLASPQRFTVELSQIKVGVGGVPTAGTVRDAFAPAQFEELSDAEKLSRPSFEQMGAGITLASGKLECTVGGGVRGLEAAYETVTINAPRRPPTPVDGTYTMSSAQQLSVVGRAAAARSGLLTSGLERFAPPLGSTPLAGLEEERFVVVGTSDLGVRPDVLKEPATKGAAFQALDAWLAGRPEDRGLLQVVPVGELETIA